MRPRTAGAGRGVEQRVRETWAPGRRQAVRGREGANAGAGAGGGNDTAAGTDRVGHDGRPPRARAGRSGDGRARGRRRRGRRRCAARGAGAYAARLRRLPHSARRPSGRMPWSSPYRPARTPKWPATRWRTAPTYWWRSRSPPTAKREGEALRDLAAREGRLLSVGHVKRLNPKKRPWSHSSSGWMPARWGRCPHVHAPGSGRSPSACRTWA